MKKCWLLISMCCCLVLPMTAFAQWSTVYQTDFDSAPYIQGNTVDGVDDWHVTVNPALSTVQNDGTGNSIDYISGTSTFSTYREIGAFSTGNKVSLTFTWAMLTSDVNSNNESYGLWTTLTNTTDPATGRAGLLGGNYNATTSAGTFKAYSAGDGWVPFGTFSLNTPYVLTMVNDMTTKTYDVYVDGQLAKSGLTFYTSNLSTVSYLHFYRRYKAGTYAIDDVLVQTVPEPSGLLAVACGVVGIFGYIRRKQ